MRPRAAKFGGGKILYRGLAASWWIARRMLFGVATGVVAAVAAIGFVDGVSWLNAMLGIAAANSGRAVSLWVLLTPAVAGLAVGLLLRWMPQRWPQNPAEIIAAAQSGRAIPVKSGVLTAIAALLGLGGGASIGQYGPLAHMGATIGSAVQKIFRVEPGLALGCGVAAAIATAFNAPIAGIIFAHEAILRRYSLRACAPITAAAAAGMFIAREVFQRPALFEVAVARPADTIVRAAEFIAFIGVGIGGALLAVLFMQAILWARRLGDALRLPLYIKPCIAGLGVGFAAQWVPEILGVGSETLRAAITPESYTRAEMVGLLLAKLLATALCLGFGFAGGVLNPALLLGVLFGALLGDFAAAAGGDAQTITFYAICGMAAVTSPVIGAPLTTILIVFELTRNYELTAAVMVGAPLASLIGRRIFARSLFDKQLSQQRAAARTD